MDLRRGSVVRFVVQYEAVIGGNRYPVVRYDCAYGFAHRDTLDRRGNVIDKRQLIEQTDLDRALQDALREVRAEWRSFRRRCVAGISEELAP